MELATSTQQAIPEKDLDDYELVQLAIGGNQRACREIVDRYQGPVYHTMLKMVKNREDADDLTQEAFGKAFHHLDSYVPRYAFSTWLFRIAVNNGIDYIRKKRLTLLSIDDPIGAQSESDYAGNLRAFVPNPEEAIIRKQRLRLMRQVLNRLNERYRLMIELRFFEELSYEEIATELNVPLGTVKAQLFRAKEMLYELLQKPGASAYLESTQRRK